jgi:mannose-6-phosphate isomerase-like protein (cupin superfamily)
MDSRVILFIVIIALILLIILLSAKSHWSGGGYTLWSADIENDTANNDNWRNIIHTTEKMQVGLMSVPPGQELGAETHSDNDQFFRIESGRGKLITDIGETNLSSGYAAIVPRGVRHNLVNTGNSPLKLYTIYSPPHHKPHTLDRTQMDEAMRN